MMVNATPIKLLHILWSGRIGGTEEYILALLRNCDRLKYELFLCVLSEEGPMLDEARRLNGVHVTFIGVKNGFDVIGVSRFAWYLIRHQFHIIHSHTRNILSTAMLYACTPKTPKILTHHVGPIDKKLLRKEKRFYTLFGGMFKKITAISKTVRTTLTDYCHVRNTDRIEVVYNGIDLRKFKEDCAIPADLDGLKRENLHVIGYVGRMEYYKRPALFVEIAHELVQRNKNLHFVMVGAGRESAKCREMIRRNGLDEYFHMLGYRRDIPNMLRVMDSLLFTSSGEGFGIVILEAMAMGLPVFAFCDGAVPEIITHGKNGILLDTVNPSIAADHISETLNDKMLLKNIGQQGREDVYARFSINVSVNMLDRVYDQALHEAGA
jgi:glycosyltransferase involved in cell wall biosynthesis